MNPLNPLNLEAILLALLGVACWAVGALYLVLLPELKLWGLTAIGLGIGLYAGAWFIALYILRLRRLYRYGAGR